MDQLVAYYIRKPNTTVTNIMYNLHIKKETVKKSKILTDKLSVSIFYTHLIS